MRRIATLCGLCLLLLWPSPAPGQFATSRISAIKIEHVGPPAVSDELIRANIRVKPGDPYQRLAVDDDVRNLYGTGFFYNIKVGEQSSPAGVILTYYVQGNPRVTEVKYEGNKKYSEKKLRKKTTTKVGEALSERKVYTDSQEIKKMYQKSGYPRTEVNGTFKVVEATGRASVVFEIQESPKVRIERVDFVGASAFTQKRLRKTIKTRRHWMFSWLTGSGTLKEDQLEEDRERLAEFYRDRGYIDFELKDIQTTNTSPNRMVVQFIIHEGKEYRVGDIQFSGNEIYSDAIITNTLPRLQTVRMRGRLGPNGLPMDVGDVFSPKGLGKNIDSVEDFYGSKGHIDVTTSTRNLVVDKIPNTDTGTMDLDFKIKEGQSNTVERVQIRGNTKTRDKVIRRELAVAPGETFDMVRVKLSQRRLEGLQYFSKVDARPEPTDVLNSKDLVISVDEKTTGNLTLGAGFSSIDQIVGFAEVTQGNFDLFNPPTFTGGGQKFRLRLQIGSERQDYEISFIEPWFLGRRLALGVDLYYRELNFQSYNDIYDETRMGARFSLTKALGSEFLIGTVSYTIENIGIDLNQGYHGPLLVNNIDPASPWGYVTGPAAGGPPYMIPANVPPSILAEEGYNLLSRLGLSLAYDTRNSVQLPDRGQRTELLTQLVGGPLGGDRAFYKAELISAWYFRGFAKGHVLELIGRTGVAEGFQDDDVPFYDRYYLGGMFTLRGFKYRQISPREEPFTEPIGGDTFWYGSAEYSIPIIERLRVAVFYDIGSVGRDPYNWNFSNFSDNWGIGLRLNLPIGPLRLDYGIPINYDKYSDGDGRFQFGVGFTRGY